MAGECQGLCGEKEVVSEDRVRFSLGTRLAGTEGTQEVGVDRLNPHSSQSFASWASESWMHNFSRERLEFVENKTDS